MVIKFQQQFTVNPMEYDVFVAMDVDKRSILQTSVDHLGMEKSTRLPYDAQNVLRYVERTFGERRVLFAYEAGPTGYGLYDEITAAGYRCLVISPSATPKASNERVKTNRIDSRKLAYLLRGGQLHGIQVPSREFRELRHLVQLREVFVGSARADKFRIKGLLLFEGIPFPETNSQARWLAKTVSRLKEMSSPAVVRFKLDQLIERMEFSAEHLARVNGKIHDFCQSHPEIDHCMELLQSIPGIGPTVGVYLLARIGDWRSIKNPRSIAGLLGLVPVESSTGDRTRRGSISRLGDAPTRNKLIEAAWTTIRIDPELREFYQRVKLRHPAHLAARKAIVAVARKLTTRIYAVLKYQRPYYRKETN